MAQKRQKTYVLLRMWSSRKTAEDACLYVFKSRRTALSDLRRDFREIDRQCKASYGTPICTATLYNNGAGLIVQEARLEQHVKDFRILDLDEGKILKEYKDLPQINVTADAGVTKMYHK